MLNHTWLKTYLTLVDTGHFTRTAERLNMTQPGVSQHIQKLEQQVGKPLLNRIGKRFELTDTGHLLAAHGHTIAAAEETFFAAIQFDNPHGGPCRFACSGSLAMLLYPEFLQRQVTHPELSVHIEAAPNHRIVQDIKSNAIDLGIITVATQDPELTETRIGVQPLCLVTPATSTYKGAPTLDQLQDIGFINHPDGHHYAEQVLSANYGNAFKGVQSIPVTGYINQLNQILLPVAQGLGFTVLPEFAVRLFPDQTAIHIVPMPIPTFEPLHLIHKRHRPLASRYQWFVATLGKLITDVDHTSNVARV